VHPSKLPSLSVGRTASELGAVRASEGAPFSIYVPEDLVPEVQRCLDKGRALQELLFEAAPRYVQALKREKGKSASKQEN